MNPFCIPDGETLRRIRILTGVSKCEAAARCGVSVETLRRWEEGKYEPRISDAERLLQVYEAEGNGQLIAHVDAVQGVDE